MSSNLVEIKKNLDCFKKNGLFFVLAFDHRGSFIKMMQEHTSRTMEASEATILKEKIISAVDNQVSGILIDEDYGLPAYKNLKSNTPFLLPVEKTGYSDEKGERITIIERKAVDLKKIGAKAVKLLLYVNHLSSTWQKQMQTAKEVIVDAHENGLPVFLEFVLYSYEGLKESSVVEVVSKAITDGVCPDVWKLPYPGSYDLAKQVTEMVGQTPWVLLTGGGIFDSFVDSYVQSKKAGAMGYVAGRSLWQEACQLFEKENELNIFLTETLPQRFTKLTQM